MDKLSIAKLKVSSIMTKNLITASPDVTVEVAVRRMIDNDVECLPIVNAKDELCGLITFRDVVKKVVYTSAFGWELTVDEIMVKNVTTISPDSTLLDTVKIMKNRHLRRLPVVDAGKKIVGLVTNFDLALFGWESE
jgi:CBS domain-containing membrane protein